MRTLESIPASRASPLQNAAPGSVDALVQAPSVRRADQRVASFGGRRHRSAGNTLALGSVS